MGKRSYIYGAGGMGREVLAHWRSIGREPSAFIDRSAGQLPDVDGVPVIALDAVADPASSDVLIALHSAGADVDRVVTDLTRRGFGSVETLWSACAREQWLPRLSYWLDPMADLAADRVAITRARGLFTDATSLRVFDQQCTLRSEGRYAGLDAPSPRDQYHPVDLPRWPEPLRLVDCGAFDGDSLRALRAAGYRIERALALEPDPANFRRLAAAVADDPSIDPIEVGVHSTSCMLSFDPSNGTAAHFDEAGSVALRVVALDALCADFHPTLIKMDIEGAELAALEGAIQVLRRDRPGLAISVYHKPADLWELPLWIADLGLDYRLYLRSHAYCGFETVLYAQSA